MRLAAVYIEEDNLFLNEPTINFGGQFFYEIFKDDNGYKLKYSKNEKYIENLFGDNISSISAIVGGNGTGKSTILQRIRKVSNLIYIFERYHSKNEGNLVVYTIRGKMKEQSSPFPIKLVGIEGVTPLTNMALDIEANDFWSEHFIRYYSPLSQYNIEKEIKDDFIFTEHPNDLSEIDRQRIVRRMQFLSDRELISTLKSKYDGIDFYKSLSIKIKSVEEQDLFDISKDFYLYYFQDSNPSLKNNSSDLDLIFLEVIEKGYSDFFLHLKEVVRTKEQKYSDLLFNNYLIFLIYCFRGVKSGIDHDSWNELNTKLIALFKTEDLYYSEKTIELIKKTVLLFSKFKYKKSIKLYDLESRSKVGPEFEDLLIDLINEVVSSQIEMNEEGVLYFQKVHSKYNKVLKRINLQNNNFNYFGLERSFMFFEPKNNISDGEKALIELLASLYTLSFKENGPTNWLLLLDEAELGFHPKWKKQFIKTLVDLLPIVMEKGNYNDNRQEIQVIFTTHDPLTLSDIPNNNIAYLDKIGKKTKVYHPNDPERPTKSFGANITDLLAQSFFISDGLVGDFAKSKIQEAIIWIDYHLDIKNKNFKEIKDLDLNKLKEVKALTRIIDEPIIKQKLIELLDEIDPDNTKLDKLEREKRLIDEQINQIKNDNSKPK